MNDRFDVYTPLARVDFESKEERVNRIIDGMRRLDFLQTSARIDFSEGGIIRIDVDEEIL